MGIRIAHYITCDECGAENLVQWHCDNKRVIKKAAKAIKFVTTTNNEFCSDFCKNSFKERAKSIN